MNSDDSANIYFTDAGSCRDSWYTVLLKYDSNGNRVWARKLPAGGVSWSGAIVDLDKRGAVYETGVSVQADGKGPLSVYVVKYRTR